MAHMITNSPSLPAEIENHGTRLWWKRLGWMGFLFFLIKGLLWLVTPGLLLYFGLQ